MTCRHCNHTGPPHWRIVGHLVENFCRECDNFFGVVPISRPQPGVGPPRPAQNPD